MKTQHHKTFRIATALALTGLLSGQAFAIDAQSNNATADVTVRLIQPISIQKDADLNFGTLVTGGNASIILMPSGTFIADGREMPSLGGQPQVAQFSVFGEPFLGYALSGATGGVNLSNENADVIGVNLYAAAQSTNADTGGILSDSGSDTIRIGGFFDITDQARGTYTAPSSINLTVNYN